MNYNIKFVLLIYLATLLCTLNTACQSEKKKAAFIITILDDSFVPEVIPDSPYLSFKTEQAKLQQILDAHQILTFEKAYPQSRFRHMQAKWKIECKGKQLATDLTTAFPTIFVEPLFEQKAVLTYTPNDYGLATNGQKTLDLVNAKGAWDITKGDPNVLIGITDTKFDLQHPDLLGQIANVRYHNPNAQNHGTLVAGSAAGKTDNGLGLASLGFNCRLDLSSRYGYWGMNELLNMSADGVKVLNASWHLGYTQVYAPFSNQNINHQNVINEVYENGGIVFWGYGNGRPVDGYCRAYTYPGSLNHNIAVTSVGAEVPRGQLSWWSGLTDSVKWNWKDVHWNRVDHWGYFYDANGIVTDSIELDMHNHTDKVDICAPGYHNEVLIDGGGYATHAFGTSFGAPIVAGAAGLMLSVNPCLTPYQIEYGLKITAFNIDTIPENVPYAGQLGAGRLDAEAAVAWAASFNCNGSTANTMYIKGIEFNTLCQPEASSNNILPKLTPLIVDGVPPFRYEWVELAGNNTRLNDNSLEEPEIDSSWGTHRVHYRLTVYDNSAIEKVASRIIDLNLSNSQTYDLAMRDSYMDMLDEPNQQANVDSRDWSVWLSPDLWNRQNNDNILEHEHPEYFSNKPNYVYSRVRNIGCTANPTGKKLRLYWSKASTGENWDEDWTTIDVMGSGGTLIPGGREITTTPIAIPVLQPGDQFITMHPWNPIRPSDYDAAVNSVDVCFLARIEESNSAPFGMTFVEDSIIKTNVFNNNNIVTRNFIVTDFNTSNKSNPHQILIGNAGAETTVFDLELVAERSIQPHFSGDLSALGTVTIYLDGLYERWAKNGFEGNYAKLNEAERSVTFDLGERSYLRGLEFQPSERLPILLELKGQRKSKSRLDQVFHLRQWEHSDKKRSKRIYGAVTFFIPATR